MASLTSLTARRSAARAMPGRSATTHVAGACGPPAEVASGHDDEPPPLVDASSSGSEDTDSDNETLDTDHGNCSDTSTIELFGEDANSARCGVRAGPALMPSYQAYAATAATASVATAASSWTARLNVDQVSYNDDDADEPLPPLLSCSEDENERHHDQAARAEISTVTAKASSGSVGLRKGTCVHIPEVGDWVVGGSLTAIPPENYLDHEGYCENVLNC